MKANKSKKKLVIVIIFLCITAINYSNGSKHLDFIKLSNKNHDKKEKEFNYHDMDLHIKKANSEQILKNLEYICRHPRKSGSDESIRVIEWIEKKLIKYGYSIQRQEFGVYRQSLESEMLGDYNNLNPYNEKMHNIKALM